jgi:hypothetical protein
MSRSMRDLAPVRLLIGALVLSCASCTHLLKPHTPPLIATCPYTPELYDKDLDAYRAAMPNDATARPIRDRMINSLICVIDDVYGQFEITFLKGRSAFSITGEGLQAGLAASATAVNGARGKTIIDAFLSGVTGLDLSIDKHLFAQQTFQAIASSMESRRNRIHERIVTRLTNETTATYPFEAARSDLAAYFYAGTLAGGLQELQAQTGSEAKQTAESLNRRMVAPATEQDVTNVSILRSAIEKALMSKTEIEVKKVRDFLSAMGETDAATATPDQLWSFYQQTASKKITEDPDARKTAFDTARRLGLIP